MVKETTKILKEILCALFNFCKNERFKPLYEQSLRLFMDISPHRDIESVEFSERDEKNFLMWLCLERIIEGKTIAEIWKEENPDLPLEKNRILTPLISSTVALYYPIVEKSVYEKLLLRDLFSGQEFYVWEPVVYQLRDKPLIYGLRIIDTGEEFLSAGDFYVFPREISEDITNFFHRHLQGFYGEEITKPMGFPRGSAYLLNHLRITLQRSDEIVRRLKEKQQTKERESIEKMVSHFWVEDYEKVIEKIQEMQNITYLGEESGYRFYEWYENPELAGKDEPNAGIVLTRRKLVIHCTNLRWAEAVKTSIKKALGAAASHIYDTLVKRRI